MNLERATALLKEADPARGLDEEFELPQVSGAAYLASHEQKRGQMRTQEDVRRPPATDSAVVKRSPRWQGPLVAAAAMVAIVVVGVAFWLLAGDGEQAPAADEPPATTQAPTTQAPTIEPAPSSEDSVATTEALTADEPVPSESPYGLPDFSSDPAKVGEALTIAQNTYDPEVFLSLFADDAELEFHSTVVTPDEIRAGVALQGTGSHFQYDRGWARSMNQREVFSSCEANGDRVICDMTVTSDHLAPLLPPIPNTVAIQIRDGKIVLFLVSGVFDPSNQILSDFQDWTYENYPEEAALMWVAEWDTVEVSTEESALLHLRLGEEYVQLQS